MNTSVFLIRDTCQKLVFLHHKIGISYLMYVRHSPSVLWWPTLSKWNWGVVLLKYGIIQFVKSYMHQSTLIVIYSLFYFSVTYVILFWKLIVEVLV